MLFGQIVIGPPGSGKSTYCKAMLDLTGVLERKTIIVNLDPANDMLPYECAIDVNKLVKLEEVMERLQLGPNGGLVYCMEFLEKNVNWLLESLKKYDKHYIIFDCPGQVELYTHLSAVKNIVSLLEKTIRLTAINIIDSHHCSDAGKFISALCMSLSSMVHFELPHINVLSKIDLIKNVKLAFRLDFYADVLDLNYLLEYDKDSTNPKYAKLNKALAGLIEDYSLVSFIPLDATSRESCLKVLRAVDKSNGYAFGTDEERNIESMLGCAMKAEFHDELYGYMQERYVDIANQEKKKEEKKFADQN